MNSPLGVIQRPLITERATNLRADANQYVFRVASGATKRDIKAAVEQLFKVQVLSVNTMRVHGKFRRMGAARGAYRPDWKKAIVALKQGQEIRIGEESK
jgi:large subunit ribosomal protein L23